MAKAAVKSAAQPVVKVAVKVPAAKAGAVKAGAVKAGTTKAGAAKHAAPTKTRRS